MPPRLRLRPAKAQPLMPPAAPATPGESTAADATGGSGYARRKHWVRAFESEFG